MLGAYTQAQDGELWVSNGTSAGTRQLKDINPGAESSYPRSARITRDDKRAIFLANDGKAGYQLWVTDGTSQGTQKIPGAPGASDEIVAFGIRSVIFRGYTQTTGDEIFISDGTAKGTKLIKDIRPEGNTSAPQYLRATQDGKKVFFTAYTPASNYELWVTDGTNRGTRMVKDIRPGLGTSSPAFLVPIGASRMLLQVDDGVSGTEIWISDGTSAGTKRVVDLLKGPQTGVSLKTSIAWGNRVAFRALSPSKGWETYVYDGTLAGTRTFRDTQKGSGSGRALALSRINAVSLWFAADDGKTGMELWTMTGGAQTRLIDINRPKSAPTESSDPASIGRFGKYIVFSANNGKTGAETWISDVSAAGTRLLKDLHPGFLGSRTRYHATAGNKLVFDASTPATGWELFVTDGSAKGTQLLKDISPGAGSTYPTPMVYTAGKVFFSDSTPKTGAEVWGTDFSSQGTRMVKDLYSGKQSGGFAYPSARNGKVLFDARTAATGNELFVSDGTTAGTKLYLDYRPGPTSGDPSRISAIGSRHVYFAAPTTTNPGWETVRADGTASGLKVIDLWPGTGGGMGFFQRYRPYRLAVGNRVYMGGIHPLYGYEVYSVDNGATAEPMGTPFGSTWLQGTDPVLGKTAILEGGTRLKSSVQITLFGSVAARPQGLGSAGFTHLDLTSYIGVLGTTRGARFRHTLQVPGIPALKGVQPMFQTLAFDPTNFRGTLELSNGLHWAVGQ